MGWVLVGPTQEAVEEPRNLRTLPGSLPGIEGLKDNPTHSKNKELFWNENC